MLFGCVLHIFFNAVKVVIDFEIYKRAKKNTLKKDSFLLFFCGLNGLLDSRVSLSRSFNKAEMRCNGRDAPFGGATVVASRSEWQFVFTERKTYLCSHVLHRKNF